MSQTNAAKTPEQIPSIPPAKPINSVPMLPSGTSPEVKLDIPIAPGPFGPTWSSIEAHYPGTPAWLREAKFGIWVHFGPQAAGESGDWYARKMYEPGTPAYQNHLAKYGHPSQSGYKEVLRDWNPSKLDPAKLTKIYKAAGARFLVIQGVHHDNFDLWNSAYQPWNSVRLGPKRDLLGEWTRAARAAKIRFGVTFHHEYTWWWWQTAFGADKTGPYAGVPYDGHLTQADGKGKWWEGLDPRMLYGIDLREYQGVDAAAHSPWSPPPAGIFGEHMAYAKWYAKNWALRMMDVVDKYQPDFIYTDGTGSQPFSGDNTGTGIKADAMQTVIAHFYNQTLKRRGKVDTFSIVKFRQPTNGTVNTEEFGIPAEIKTNQAWIGETPVGDWFYAPGFTYDAGMMIHYIIEAISHDGNAAVCVSLQPDGSLDEGSLKMLDGVGRWMKINGEAVYGSKAWKVPGEGEMENGHLRMLPGGGLRKWHAEFKFTDRDYRYTVGKNGALYALSMKVPEGGSEVRLVSLGRDKGLYTTPVHEVKLLGSRKKLQWRQDADALVIEMPRDSDFATGVVFRIR